MKIQTKMLINSIFNCISHDIGEYHMYRMIHPIYRMVLTTQPCYTGVPHYVFRYCVIWYGPHIVL